MFRYRLLVTFLTPATLTPCFTSLDLSRDIDITQKNISELSELVEQYIHENVSSDAYNINIASWSLYGNDDKEVKDG